MSVKRILFVFPSLGIGGTTVSTRHLISLLLKEGYECWAMPLSPNGGLSDLYKDVKMVPTPYIIRALSISSWKDEPSFFKKTGMASLRLLRNLFGGFERIVVRYSLGRLVKKYSIDTIVACQEGISTRFVSYINYECKIAWVRCDYKRMLDDIGRQREEHYSRFKSVVCVSEQTFNSFREVFPEYKSKTYCIPNPQDETMILQRAEVVDNDPRFKQQGLTFVSIGRLDKVKRFTSISEIAKKLSDMGLRFHWYIIGDGDERHAIENSINALKMDAFVIMLGAKTNPYYYIKRSDALICTSRSEACPRVINEAKILHTPTVSTDFPSVYEFICNGENGLISTLEDMHLSIMRLFSDNDVYSRIQNGISSFSFDNTELINKIKSIL